MRKKLGFLIVSTTLSSMILAQAANTANKPAAKTTAKSIQSAKTTKAPATDSKENKENKENIESKTTQSTQADSKDSTNSTESKATTTKKKKLKKPEGIFVGVYGGLTTFFYNNEDNTTGFNLGGKVGYISYFGKILGWRTGIYLDYVGFRETTSRYSWAVGGFVNETRTVSLFSLIARYDLLFDVIHNEKFSITPFVGIGTGLSFTSGAIGYALPLSFGVLSTFKSRHQAELDIKIPLNSIIVGLPMFSFSLGYSYIF